MDFKNNIHDKHQMKQLRKKCLQIVEYSMQAQESIQQQQKQQQPQTTSPQGGAGEQQQEQQQKQQQQ